MAGGSLRGSREPHFHKALCSKDLSYPKTVLVFALDSRQVICKALGRMSSLGVWGHTGWPNDVIGDGALGHMVPTGSLQGLETKAQPCRQSVMSM